jgi:hypothetical protein
MLLAQNHHWTPRMHILEEKLRISNLSPRVANQSLNATATGQLKRLVKAPDRVAKGTPTSPPSVHLGSGQNEQTTTAL